MNIESENLAEKLTGNKKFNLRAQKKQKLEKLGAEIL